MPLIYFHQTDEPAGNLTGQYEDDSWWSGSQLNFARLALATLLATTALSTSISANLQIQDEIPAGSLKGQPDEDFWQNPVAPVKGSLLWQQQWSFDEQIPAGNLVAPREDEDFWQNPVAPALLTFRRFEQRDNEEIPAGSLHGQPDEDFWFNPTVPVQAKIYQQIPYFFDAVDLPPAVVSTTSFVIWIQEDDG